MYLRSMLVITVFVLSAVLVDGDYIAREKECKEGKCKMLWEERKRCLQEQHCQEVEKKENVKIGEMQRCYSMCGNTAIICLMTCSHGTEAMRQECQKKYGSNKNEHYYNCYNGMATDAYVAVHKND